MITINGTTIVTPSDYKVGIEDITKSDRNANGTMMIEIIATKRKLECKWNYLSQTAMATLLGLISATTFTIQYPDPDGTMKTGTFYKGGRNIPAIDYQNSVIRWKDISINFIEI